VPRPHLPTLDEEVKRFFKAFGPAVIGSAGVQLAMLADTIIVTFLPSGGASSLYYADRLYQLPIGVIGIAAGTVLLPEMSRLISGGQETEAHRQQNRSLALSWLLAMPFFAAFLIIPETIVSAMFERGAFGTAAAANTAKVLAAYAVGLPAIVAIRSIVASFHARGDTTTPLYASLTAIAINLALKLVFWKSMGAAGLAIATAVGAIANFTILYALAWRQKKTSPDSTLALHASLVIVAAIWLAVAFIVIEATCGAFAPLPRVVIHGLAGGALYAGMIYFGFRVFKLPFSLR
jgi:putative peptidoglycan lipid II flippase